MPFGFESKEEFENAVAAISSQQAKRVEDKLKQFKKETADDFSKQLEQFGTNLGTKLSSLEGAIQTKRDKKRGTDGKTVDDEPDDAAKVDPLTRTLQRQIEELKAENKKRDEQLTAERAKTRTITVKQKLREGLEKRGVTDPYRVKAATAVLLDQEKKVGFSESFDDAAGFDTDGAPIELDTFLDGWLKTDEGQFFAPPKGAQGTGRAPARPMNRGGGREQDNGGVADVGDLLADAIRRGDI